jgi:predicted PurR-regulated permease PerM
VSDQNGAAVARPRVHPTIDRLGATSWRLICIGVVGLAALWLLSRLRVVVAPIVIALFLTRGLAPIAGWLRRRRFKPALAALTAMLVFFGSLAGIAAAIIPSLADQAESLGPTLTQAADDVEDWLVEDSPFEVSRDTIDRLREQTGARVNRLLESSDGAVLDSATLAAEIVAGIILAILLTFFMLRDGSRFVSAVIGRARPERQPKLRRAADRGWATLGGYLRGAAMLGVVEATIIGLTLFFAGGDLVAPVVIITFLGAFIPIVGAFLAGLVAVLVGLVTGGIGTAVIVAIVAFIVQQLDNDLLAPWIYGRALSLHPVAVLLSVVAGGALFGFAGTVLAVPVVAVVVNVWKELREGPTAALDLSLATDLHAAPE